MLSTPRTARIRSPRQAGENELRMRSSTTLSRVAASVPEPSTRVIVASLRTKSTSYQTPSVGIRVQFVLA